MGDRSNAVAGTGQPDTQTAIVDSNAESDTTLSYAALEAEALPPQQASLSRRAALALAGGGAALLAGLGSTTAEAGWRFGPKRELSVVNLHTGDRLKAVYWADGQYDYEAMREFCYVLRDHRANRTTDMDPGLFGLLHDIRLMLATSQPIEVFSGYRSPATNGALRRRSRGVARRSFHMLGKAVDLRIPGRDVRRIYRTAQAMQRGGTGLYTSSGFVHVDTGPVRSW